MARNVLYISNKNPSLYATLTDGSGNIINLTGYTVQFALRREFATVNLFKSAAVIVAPTAGTVRYDFGTGDLAGAPGIYWGQWIATDSSSKPENIDAGYFELRKAA